MPAKKQSDNQIKRLYFAITAASTNNFLSINQADLASDFINIGSEFFSTTSLVIIHFSIFFLAGRSYIISSIKFSTIERNARAPVFFPLPFQLLHPEKKDQIQVQHLPLKTVFYTA